MLVDKKLSPKEQAKVIKDIAGGPLQLALECTGVESSIHTAVFVSNQFTCLKLILMLAVYHLWGKSLHHWYGEE